MARAYSDDLRERAALAVARGHSCRSVAALFDVSVASVAKWSQRYRATGSAAAKSMGGTRRSPLAPHREWILKRMEYFPHLTLRELVADLEERGVETSIASVWRLVRSDKDALARRSVRKRTAKASA